MVSNIITTLGSCLVFAVVAIPSLSSCTLIFDDAGDTRELSEDAGAVDDASISSNSDATVVPTDFCAPSSNVGSTGADGTMELDLQPKDVLTIDTTEFKWGVDGAGQSPSQLSLTKFTSTDIPGVVFAVLSLTQHDIAEGATLRATGENPLVIVVNGNVQINGTIDVSSSTTEQGAGGFAGGAMGTMDTFAGPGATLPSPYFCGMNNTSDCGGAVPPTSNEHGGSGGSHKFPGGMLGGNSIDPATIFGRDDLVPLFGGGGGSGAGGKGGNGGGAIQISAAGTISVNGSIFAGGAGGSGAVAASSLALGGGGAGAGGAILLEARTIDIGASAKLTVHDGSGATGNLAIANMSPVPGTDGITGPALPAGTGPNTPLSAGPLMSGGAGSNIAGVPENASTGSSTKPFPGGGGAGGGAGRIRLNSQGDITISDNNVFPRYSVSVARNWCD